MLFSLPTGQTVVWRACQVQTSPERGGRGRCQSCRPVIGHPHPSHTMFTHLFFTPVYTPALHLLHNYFVPFTHICLYTCLFYIYFTPVLYLFFSCFTTVYAFFILYPFYTCLYICAIPVLHLFSCTPELDQTYSTPDDRCEDTSEVFCEIHTL